MKMSIFIRTYWKDSVWLSYCLRSINKFCSGFDKIVVVCPVGSGEIITSVCLANGFEAPFICPNRHSGYLCQQVTKLEADIYIPDADAILYVDSDVCFTVPVTPDSFLVGGKVRLLYESYERLKADTNVQSWRPIMRAALGLNDIDYEWMRTLPIVHYAETIKRTRKWLDDIHPEGYERYIMSQPGKEFSEFNAEGEIAFRCFAEKYFLHKIDDLGSIPSVLRQFWSVAGITEEDKKWMEEILK